MNEYAKDVRRKDRQIKDDTFLTEMLHESLACSIAIEREGHPLLHTAFYAYDAAGEAVTFHFSKHGWAGNEITTGKKATISMYKYGKLYTAQKAVDFGSEYKSVMIYGKVRLITDDDEKRQTLELLFQKFFSGVAADSYKPFTLQEAGQINVASVKIDDWTGKAHLKPASAIDSFYHPSNPVF